MGRLQVVAVALCILLLAVDGFDVLSISFAAPGIAAEWGIDRAALGLVLSMELIGMGVGALVALLEADRGASAEEALKAGRAAGLTRLEDVVKDRLEADDGGN